MGKAEQKTGPTWDGFPLWPAHMCFSPAVTRESKQFPQWLLKLRENLERERKCINDKTF